MKESIIWAIAVFILVFLVNYFVIFRGSLNRFLFKNKSKSSKKKKKEKPLEEYIGFSYVIPRFKLDIKKMNINYAAIIISLTNAFIIALSFFIICLIKWSIAFKMLIGFVLVFLLIYAMYELVGRYFFMKGWSKDGIK